MDVYFHIDQTVLTYMIRVDSPSQDLNIMELKKRLKAAEETLDKVLVRLVYGGNLAPEFDHMLNNGTFHGVKTSCSEKGLLVYLQQVVSSQDRSLLENPIFSATLAQKFRMKPYRGRLPKGML